MFLGMVPLQRQRLEQWLSKDAIVTVKAQCFSLGARGGSIELGGK